MATSLIDADSLLAIDVGAVTTRALLFDVVDGRYRFLGCGAAPSTAGAPFHDIGEGVRRAIDQLQSISGHTLVGANEQLITPANAAGEGVDTFAATISAGAPLKVLAAGLLEDVSLGSARRLANATYSGAIETISLNDRRKPEARIDAILRQRPNLIVMAGGTENGASQSVLKLLESIGLACYLMPESFRPELLYAGNGALHDEVEARLSKVTNLHFAQNIRPQLDTEQIEAAQARLSEIYSSIRVRQIPGVKELDEWARGGLMPTAAAFGRIIRFLSQSHVSKKGVLGVDIGASAVTLAAAFAGELTLGVYPHLGLGEGLKDLLSHVPLNEITRWLPLEIPDSYLREYLFNKSIYPASLPATAEDLAIEQALARAVLQIGLRLLSGGFSARAASAGVGLLPWVEPVVATGSVLTRAPTLAQTMLMLLDGVQPTGATTFVLDQNHLSPSLGAAAAINPILAVQVLDSSAFLHLGTVISPVGNARPGTPVLRVKMTYDSSGQETTLEVKQGVLEVLPLPAGQTAHLQLQPLHRYDVGMGGAGRSGRLKVSGGALGVVIDARGRPLRLPDDAARRRELLRKWLWTLGG